MSRGVTIYFISKLDWAQLAVAAHLVGATSGLDRYLHVHRAGCFVNFDPAQEVLEYLSHEEERRWRNAVVAKLGTFPATVLSASMSSGDESPKLLMGVLSALTGSGDFVTSSCSGERLYNRAELVQLAPDGEDLLRDR